MDRIYKGDLVMVKSTQQFGIVVEIVRRSPQNPDWDLICVHYDGSIDEVSPRTLTKNVNKFVKSVKDVEKVDKLSMYLAKRSEYVKERNRK
tara:strand:+ start:731 stop:1003 length:273 start_codon:yes stop_codon:yes gene_type:complete